MADKKQGKEEQASVHESLEGFDIKINEFGEISSSMDIDSLNAFLDEQVDDKKLIQDHSTKEDDNEETNEESSDQPR